MPPVNLAQALARASSLSGRSALSLAVELIGAMRGVPRLAIREYFTQGAWIGPASPANGFVGNRSSRQLNLSLTDTGHQDQTALFNDKYLTGVVLQAHGVPVAEVRAVFATDRSYGALPTLRTAGDLAAWIATPGHLPAFAKPVDRSMSVGAIPLRQAGVVGQVDIGGTVVPIAQLAAEVAQTYPTGWLIQDLIRQPEAIEALIGPGVGTVRLVSLWEAAGPQVLYAAWRHPAAGTWIDEDLIGKPTVGCALDPVTGTVQRAHLGNRFTGREITRFPMAPDTPLHGFPIPDWAAMVDICCAAHRLFPGHSVLGWDIAMSERGPLICEVNARPQHMSYQRAFGRGFLHPAHVARLDAARQLMIKRCT